MNSIDKSNLDKKKYRNRVQENTTLFLDNLWCVSKVLKAPHQTGSNFVPLYVILPGFRHIVLYTYLIKKIFLIVVFAFHFMNLLHFMYNSEFS